MVVLLALANDWRERGLGSALLTELERRLMSAGVHRLSALPAEGETGVAAFRNCGYQPRDPTYFERVVPLQPEEVGLLGELGDRMLPAGLWEALAGMEHEKQLIERRIVLPLVDPDLAEAYGVEPARAAVLFGPPGTGKTTFAKAVASRLRWPFVEMLKLIPLFRERGGRLLVCATNFVRALDPAFLRHGRFDYVIPIGAPDAAARTAIWTRYIPAGVLGSIDADALVEASELFTAADIEFSARKGSQRALEAAVHGGGQDQPDVRGPATADYLAALDETRPTLTTTMVDEFTEDIAAIARL